MTTLKKRRSSRYLISADGFPIIWEASLPAARQHALALAEGGLRGVPGLLPIDFARVTVVDTWNQGVALAAFRVGAER
jgi:hypothetical protein